MGVKSLPPIARFLHTRPLLPAALLFLAGCLLAWFLHPSALLMGVVGAVCIAGGILLLRRNRRWAAALLVLALLPLGAARFELAWDAAAPHADQGGAQLAGRIVSLYNYDKENERRICLIDDIQIDGEAWSGQMRLYLHGDEAVLRAVTLGETVECTAHIRCADNASNPYEFDFANHLRVRNIRGYATTHVETASFGPAVLKISDYPTIARDRIAARIDDLFPESAAVIKAFLIGDRSDLSEDLRSDYAASGVSHLLAISGMHISILAGLCMLILRRICNRKWAFGITLALLLLYGALIGFTASLLRATIMFALYNAAPLFGRKSDSPTNLCAAMLINLFIRPMDAVTTSFVLSYSASAGIILLSDPIRRLLCLDRIRPAPTGRGLRHALCVTLPRAIAKSAVVTIAAQVATLPAVVYFFGVHPLLGIVTNIPAVPLAMGAYIAAIFATIVPISPLVWLADHAFLLLNRMTHFIGSLPISTLSIARFPWWLTLLMVLALLCASPIMRTPRRFARFLPLLLVPCILVSELCSYCTTLDCSIVFLDAGEADCAVIRTEGHVYLVDAGDSYSPVADYMQAMNYHIDAVFLTHPHADHVCGLDDLLNVCTPEVIYIGPNWDCYSHAESVDACLEKAREQGVEIRVINAGDRIELSENTFMDLLYPQAGICADSANNDSMLLKMQYGECTALFCADLSADSMPKGIGDIDIMKVPHHGAADVLSGELMCETSPSVAIISADESQGMNHPSEDTLFFLNGAEARVFRTDLFGAITCRLEKDGTVNVRTYLSPEQ